MHQFYILNQDPNAQQCFEFIRQRQLEHSVHLNRTRFWVPAGQVLTEFMLRFGDCCPQVDPQLDLATGLKSDI